MFLSLHEWHCRANPCLPEMFRATPEVFFWKNDDTVCHSHFSEAGKVEFVDRQVRTSCRIASPATTKTTRVARLLPGRTPMGKHADNSFKLRLRCRFSIYR